MQVDIDPTSGLRLEGTPPKPTSTPAPNLTWEALLAGQAGREDFVVFADQEGRSGVVGFTRLLQFELEEATMEAAREWKFEPGMQEGRRVAVRIPMFIGYKRPVQQYHASGAPEWVPEKPWPTGFRLALSGGLRDTIGRVVFLPCRD